MSNLQVVPPGLLGFLGVKNFGVAPSELGNTYAPVLPMIPWAFLAKAEFQQDGAAGVAANFAGFTNFAVSGATPLLWTVPNGEWWYIHTIAAEVSAGAAADVLQGMTPAYQVRIGGSVATVPMGVSQNFTNTGTIANIYQATVRDFWVPPGAALGVWWNSVFAAAKAVSLITSFTRLPI